MPKNDRERQLHAKKWSIIQSVDAKAQRLDLDDLDLGLISLMIKGHTNSEIAKEIRKPLSTVQRRTRKIIEKGFVIERAEPNFKSFGFKKGMIQVSLNGADPFTICNRLVEIDGITHASAYLGNADVTAFTVYKDSKDMIELIARVRKIEGVNQVSWSEEIYSIP